MDEVEDVCSNPEETTWIDESDISQLCRVCANPNEYLIPIFHGEGIENDIQSKISKHLPIEVSENDTLPVQLCYQCASTLIAWHDMVIGCMDADEKLRSLLSEKEKEGTNVIRNEETCIEDQSAAPNKASTNKFLKETVKLQPIADSFRNTAEQTTMSPNFGADKVVGEEIIPFEPEIVEVFTQQRSLASFSAFQRMQTALKMHQWMSNGSVFCMICGKMNQNPSTLIKHLSSEHRIFCGQCRAVFTSKDLLSVHMSLHDSTPERLSGKKLNFQEVSNQVDDIFNESVCTLQPNYKTKCPSKKNCKQKTEIKNNFCCDKCLLVFCRRYDLKRHKVIFHSVKSSDKENSGDKNVNFAVKEIESRRGINESQKHMLGSVRRDFEDVDMNYSDDSVNSVDIQRHLDINSSQIKNEIEDNKPFSCTICEFACSEKQEMLSHRRKEHPLKEKKSSSQKSVCNKSFLCSVCQNSYSRSSDLQRHILKKHGGEKFMGRCLDSVDDMSIEIINQAKQDINGTIVYRCDVCDKKMLTKRGFVRHIRIHRGERPFTCHVCGRQYRSHPDLTRHLRSVHDKIKNYPCDICSRSFASKGTRDDHRRTHTGERPYICHTCGKAFPTPNSIYVHRRTHSDYFPHHCTTCNKSFRRKQQLTHHMTTHTGEKLHSCDICGKSFGVKGEVSRHRQTHSNEKPHICPICGICFGQKRYLTNHLKTHHSRAL